MNKLPIIMLAILTALTGCTKKQMEQNPTKVVDGKIISSRPQNKDRFIALVKLNSPSLLAGSSKKDGKLIVDQELKAQILKEQSQLIEKFKKMDPSIKVINTYKMVLNAIAVVAPIKYESEFKKMSSVSYVERENLFSRAVFSRSLNKENPSNLEIHNSTTFIGAVAAQKELGISGKGISVGIIDTGIDFTHSAMGGPGTKEAFESVNPDKDSVLYPNNKVVGGIDLVGTTYNAASPIMDQKIPTPDSNPMDEGGHGTHVAGSVAGIGDNVNTYNGVAPEAKLHAIKVFGKNGSTGDTVVVAALEYAADPNGDLDPSDKLDVINLSLGGGYGKPHILYSEAIKNLVRGGTITVASAGNSGHNSYIVGAPSTAKEAISVAAGIDDMKHNIEYRAVAFKTSGRGELLAEAVEGNISKPITDELNVSGELAYIGNAATDLTDEQVASVNGKVALIDRGVVTFKEKLDRAFAAGAIGAIVANNRPGDPISMGGDGKVEIPAIMITQTLGNTLKEEIKNASVEVNFVTETKISKPELIDTLTGFSSKGPRSDDSLIKPEISAPGYNIISAKLGGGAEGVKMSGTSMSGPHIAGVMALLREHRPDLSVLDLKAALLGSAKSIHDKDKNLYPISQQGAGRVQVLKAAKMNIIARPSTLSLGEVLVSKQKTLRRTITLKNISSEEQTISLKAITNKRIKVKSPVETITLAPGVEREVEIFLTLNLEGLAAPFIELDGLLTFVNGEKEVLRIPLLAVTKKVSKIKAKSLKVSATDYSDAMGANVELTLTNEGFQAGEALIFNLLGTDKRKDRLEDENVSKSRTCDLQSAGYRIVERDGKRFLQFGVKIYNPVTTWQGCEVSVLIDGNQDGEADQELAGVIHTAISGLDGERFNSFLLDATKVRELRKKFEKDYQDAVNAGKKPNSKADYTSAIQAVSKIMQYDHATINVVEAEVDLLAKNAQGKLSFKLAVLHEDPAAVEADDYLGNLDKWKTINVEAGSLAFNHMPEVVKVLPNTMPRTVNLTKGFGKESLLILYPNNTTTNITNIDDEQSEILKPSFL